MRKLQGRAKTISSKVRYGGAAAVLALTVALQSLVSQSFGNQYAFGFLFLAILVTAWFGGFGPAALVSVFGLITIANLFPEQDRSEDGGIGDLIFYILITLGIATLGAAMARARLRAEIAAEKLQTTLASIGDAVLVTDREGRVVSLNASAEELTGWDEGAALGRPLDDVYVVLDQPAQGSHLVSKDGRQRAIENSVSPIRSREGTVLGSVLVFRDVTERKQAEENQRRDQEKLQHLASQLVEADRRKDSFLATLAHELRNPLAPISSGLEVIKLTDDPEEIREVCGVMERQTRQLVALVDDLLDMSRVTSGKLELRKSSVSLDDVLRSAIEAVRPMIAQAGHSLSNDPPAQIIRLDADPHRLAQVFSNLLANAAKYTPPGGEIRVRAEKKGDEAVVSVRDNGIGIPARDRERIFEMFGQIDHPLQRAASGLGIGLTLVKSLVEMHGGSIEVHSEGADLGSMFVVRLPVQEESPTAAPSETEAPRNNGHVASCRVLVADDNPAAAKLLSMTVRMLGNDVRTANDGQEAVEIAEQFRPDLVLMDIGMPKMNGYDAARAIRQQPWGEKMVLVAVSGWGQEEDKSRSREAGFDHHLVKPAPPAELRRLLAASARKA